MNKKTILIIIGFILAIIATAIITIAIVKSKDEKTFTRMNINDIKVQEEENKVNFEKQEITEKENIKSDSDIKKSSINKKNDTNKVKETETEKNQSSEEEENSVTEQPKVNEETTKNTQTEEKKEISEEVLVSYIETISNENDENKLKNGFVTVVDFLFYGGEIYSKTFIELSNGAKLKIITLALKIDSKIDEYFPDYKESISNTTNKVYTSIKSKLVSLYLDTTVKVCNNNSTLCEDAKEGLGELKKNFNITWEFIKDISGVGLTKLKNWYEIWREE